jgi:hypothetical protein
LGHVVEVLLADDRGRSIGRHPTKRGVVLRDVGRKGQTRAERLASVAPFVLQKTGTICELLLPRSSFEEQKSRSSQFNRDPRTFSGRAFEWRTERVDSHNGVADVVYRRKGNRRWERGTKFFPRHGERALER